MTMVKFWRTVCLLVTVIAGPLRAEAPGGDNAQAAEVRISFADAAALKDFKTVSRYQVRADKPGFGGTAGMLSCDNTGVQGELLYYTARKLNLTTGGAALGVSFQAAPETGKGVSRIMLALAESTRVNLISEQKKLGVRLFRAETPKDPARPWVFQLINGLSTRDLGEPFTLTSGDWYRIELELNPAADGKNVTFKVSLQQYNAAGVQKGELSRTGEGRTLLSTSQYKVDAMVVGLLGQNNGGGAVAFDELTIQSRSAETRRTEAAVKNPLAAVQFPTPPLDPAARAPANTIFGSVGHAIHTSHFYPEKTDSYWEPANVLGFMLDARLGWVREGMYQSWFANRERKDVDKHRRLFEQYLELYQQHGMKVMLCLMAVPPSDPWSKYNSDFFDYAAELARRYSCVRVVEMHNEPNLKFFWKGTPRDYVQVYSEAAKKVKQARADVQIAVGSISSLSWEPGVAWMDEAIAAGAMEFADAVSVHPYNRNAPPEIDPHATQAATRPGGHYEEAILAWWRRLSGSSSAGKRLSIYFTELGYSSINQGIAGTGGEKQQADYLSRLMLSYLNLRFNGLPLEGVFWYDFKDDGVRTDNGEHHFGLIKHDLSRVKEAYETYRRIAAFFENPSDYRPESLAVSSSNAPDAVKLYTWRRSDGALVLPFWKLSEPDLGREEFATELGVPWPQDLAVKRVTLHDLAAATPRLLGFRRDGPEMRTAVLVGPRAKWLVIE